MCRAGRGILKPGRNLTLDKQYGDTTGSFGLPAPWKGSVFRRGQKFFELANHLGNVLVTISDKKLGIDTNGDSTVNYYMADVMTANDYYPFGMGMPERRFAATNAYRYGFNGKENDNEVKDYGLQLDYGFRVYDPRLGKFLSIDPLQKTYPMFTPYQFSSNTPVVAVDIDGLEADKELNNSEKLKEGIGYVLKITADQIGIVAKVLVNLNPYTRIVLAGARQITKKMVNDQAIILHKSAVELEHSYRELQKFYHQTGFYGLEFGAFEDRFELALDYNYTIDGMSVSMLPEVKNSDYWDHEESSHNKSASERSITFHESISDMLTQIENSKHEALTNANKSRKVKYDNEKFTFNRLNFLLNFNKELSLESIASDVASYFKDLVNGPQKEDAIIIDDIKKWLDPNVSKEEKEKSANNLINYYIENSKSEKAYRLKVAYILEKIK